MTAPHQPDPPPRDPAPRPPAVPTDRDRFDELVRTHGAVLHRVARALCRSDAVAQDAVQDAYLDAWKAIGTLRDPSRGRAWLLTILRRRIHRGWRWRLLGAIGTAESLAAGEIADPAPDLFRRIDDREAIDRALATVPEPYREALVLVFLAEISPTEAAAQLGVPKNTILSRLHRGRAALRTALTRATEGGTA